MINDLSRLLSAPYYHYSPLITSHDLLKAVAIFFMIVDHIGLYYYGDNPIYRVLGRTTLPAWFFLVGYSYKRPSQNFDFLLIISLVLQITLYSLGKNLLPLNALFSIYLCRFFLPYIKIRNDFEWIIICTLFLALYFYSTLLFEYGTIAILISYYGYKAREGSNVFYSATTCIIVCLSQVLSFDFSIAEIIMCITLISMCFVSLHFYKLSTYKTINAFSIPIKILSRYSLFIYCFHLILIFMLRKFL